MLDNLDSLHRVNNGYGLLFRNLIERRARQLGNLCQRISDIADCEAVQIIQQKEGHTPCFGRVPPLRPAPDDDSHCTENQCLWRNYCRIYRTTTPLDKAFPGEKPRALDRFRALLLSRIKAPHYSTPEATVGVKFRSFDRLHSVTKKMLLASPTTVISELAPTVDNIGRNYLIGRTMESSDIYKTNATFTMKYHFIHTSDLSRLLKWLSDVESFIATGNVDYWPISCSATGTIWVDPHNQLNGDYGSDFIPPDMANCKTFEAPHIGVPDGDVMLTDSIVAPLLNIDLPALENASLPNIFRLMTDFPDELCAFRDFFYRAVEDIRGAAIGSEQFTSNCRRLERDIRDHVRKLESDCKKSRLRAAFELTGLSVASWTLAIYCILNEGTVLSVIGPGGVAYKISKEVSTYLRSRLDLRDDPVYLLWRLGSTTR